MKYIMKQKLFSFNDEFVIKDEDDNELFYVDSKTFPVDNKLSFQNLEGKELACITKKVLSIDPSYEIYKHGILYTYIKKPMFSQFKCKFINDIPGFKNYVAEGDFFAYEYNFYKDKQKFVTVSKKWLPAFDAYGVDIKEHQDDILILACTVVIDMMCN